MLSDWAHVQGSSVVQREQQEYDVKKKHQRPQSCLPIYLCKVLIGSLSQEAYSEPCQTSKVECFAKIVNGFYPLTFLTKASSQISGRVLNTSLIGYEYWNCKDSQFIIAFHDYSSLLQLFPKITTDALLMRRRPLRCTFQWLRLSEMFYSLSLIRKT